MSETILFVSNYFNYHQKPFSDAMFSLIGDGYQFIETSPKAGKGRTAGMKEARDCPSYVKNVHEDDERKIRQDILEADCVIEGAAERGLLGERIKAGKIIFSYSERILKRGLEPHKYLYRLCRLHKSHGHSGNRYLLCASSYLAWDMKLFFLYRNRTYKWGYFTPVGEYTKPECVRHGPVKYFRLVWAARLIGLKHPELVLRLAEKLKAAGFWFEIKMLGDGPLKPHLEEEIKKRCLENCVSLLGVQPYSKVRECMREADIFLFTSDFNEGWGAVLNEAMDGGCACVASHAAGSTGFLIRHKENGLIYRDGDFENFYENVAILMKDDGFREKIAGNAYDTIRELWNGQKAAERFLELYHCIQKGRGTPFQEGPCSTAFPVSQRRMPEYLGLTDENSKGSVIS